MSKPICRAAINACMNRMIEGQQQAVRAALKAGEKVVSCGRYHTNGPLVLVVTTPDSWRKLEAFRNSKTVNCIIPVDKAAATELWAEKRIAAQEEK